MSVIVTSPGHSCAATISASVTVLDSNPPEANQTCSPEAISTANTAMAEGQIITTDSMVTVRLSDAEGLRGLPSPTPTLKLVTDENAEEEPSTDSSPEPIFLDAEQTESPTAVSPSRRFSVSSADSEPDSQKKGVDWEGLERTEDEHSNNDDESEEKTAFLLARLERENSRLERDPKAAHIATEGERPPSIRELKNMMKNADPEKLRYSQLPMPPLTDLDFYAALVADYPRCASKLPYLVSKKIRGGVPPPLRGVVWVSMSGARDSNLEGLYEQLLGETSPYEHMIFKDLGRTGLEMFRQEGGEGQRMLGRVLRAFSIYDMQIGYCQGLGFLVGPLLMHMGEKEAFCVLVRLMEHYDLRSCFLPNMYGLQLRMYQFQQLLSIHLPELAAHLHNLGIQPTYAAQWFLSFFAVTCPLPMLLRIYDVIFAEGAPETLMRVALSIMGRNEKRLMASSEFEDVMQMLLARGLWDPYGCNANDLVEDFVGLSSVVTRETLAELEKRFVETHPDDKAKVAPTSPTPSVEKVIQQSATTFLGRLWGAAPRPPSVSRPTSIIRRTPSKQSLSTVSSYDSASETGSASTAATTMSRCSSIVVSDEPRHSTRSVRRNKDNDLHAQIEDLLVALSALQRENAQKEDEIQALKEAREHDRKLTKTLVELLGNGNEDNISEINDLCDQITYVLSKEEVPPISPSKNKELTEQLQKAKDDLAAAHTREKALEAKIAEQADDISRLRQQNNEIKSRWQDGQKVQAKLERQLSDLRHRKNSTHSEASDSPVSGDWEPQSQRGLREFKLGRSPSTQSQTTFNKRSSSLGMQSILSASENNGPPPADTLLMELVASKTAEAVAKQEAEEAKAKLEALKKAMDDMNMMNMANEQVAQASPGLDKGFGFLSASAPASTQNTPQPAAAGPFGRWGWGAKR
ncbi:rab-GTPase-TBC domain-containing protein [Kalaharituber pfeilii]|nr:rab-GTPase-TBC domain-containing protein [Kalaharituber pfeilii]